MAGKSLLVPLEQLRDLIDASIVTLQKNQEELRETSVSLDAPELHPIHQSTNADVRKALKTISSSSQMLRALTDPHTFLNDIFMGVCATPQLNSRIFFRSLIADWKSSFMTGLPSLSVSRPTWPTSSATRRCTLMKLPTRQESKVIGWLGLYVTSVTITYFAKFPQTSSQTLPCPNWSARRVNERT